MTAPSPPSHLGFSAPRQSHSCAPAASALGGLAGEALLPAREHAHPGAIKLWGAPGSQTLVLVLPTLGQEPSSSTILPWDPEDSPLPPRLSSKHPMPEAAEPHHADQLTVRKSPSRKRRGGPGKGAGGERPAEHTWRAGPLCATLTRLPRPLRGWEVRSRRKGNWSVENREMRSFPTNRPAHSPGWG